MDRGVCTGAQGDSAGGGRSMTPELVERGGRLIVSAPYNFMWRD